MSPRVRRIREAFVASASLRPMAQQLIQDRSPAAYAGVEAYARAHAKEDAGALSWLVVGYAHVLDHDFAKAIDPLNRAKPRAGDLGDYVAYYLGTCYLQTGRQGEALATLANFGNAYPDSLLVRDANVSYAGALLTEGRAAEAAEFLEKDRLPARSDIEFTLGRAYAGGRKCESRRGLGQRLLQHAHRRRSGRGLRGENKECRQPPPTAGNCKTRADLLMKARRYNDAADEYREIAIHASPENRPAAVLWLADAMHRAGRNREARSELTTLPGATADQSAERLYILGEIAWALDENEAFYQLVNDLRTLAPTSPWLESALLAVGNLHLVNHEYDQAIDYFREMQQRFPKGTRASYAHWKAAWLSFRQGRTADARQGFEEQIGLYPDSQRFPRLCTGAPALPKKTATYRWRGRFTRSFPTASATTITRS